MNVFVLPSRDLPKDRLSGRVAARVAQGALLVAAAAAVLAWFLAGVIHLGQDAVVVSVMVVAFVASWIVTNRRPVERPRLTLVPVRVHSS